MTVNDSSSSVINRVAVDHRWAPIPSRLLTGTDLELVAPLSVVTPGAMPPRQRPIERASLAAALGTANDGYGHPGAMSLAAKLADPNTQVVVTGQQPGLWGGPLLTLVKALAAVRWAEAIERAGTPAMAVFWIATEDHDWREVAQASIVARNQVERLSLGDDPAPLLPVGMRTLGPSLEAIEAQLADVYPGADRRLESLRRGYRPESRFGEAFARLLVDLMGERTPLLLDSMLPAVKQAQRPFLRTLVEEREALDGLLQARERAVLDAGLPLQVTPQPGVSPLFLVRGGERRRIEWREGGQWSLRGTDDPRPVADLLATIDDNPAVVSPGVLARPAMQDAILGTALMVLGPAELSYMTQASASHQLLGIPTPAITLRPSAVLVEARQMEHLRELGVSVADVLEQAPTSLVAAVFEGEPLAAPRERVAAALDEIRQVTTTLDASLARPFEKTREQIDRALDKLSEKVTGASARRHEVWLRRLEKIQLQLLPDGAWQERVMSVGHFLLRYGPDFADSLFDQLELDPRYLSVVEI
ncbi:MAG: bacillithiol biosynthesis cysteine-adding enzyme BshC [Acidobacteriota bacterium]